MSIRLPALFEPPRVADDGSTPSDAFPSKSTTPPTTLDEVVRTRERVGKRAAPSLSALAARQDAEWVAAAKLASLQLGGDLSPTNALRQKSNRQLLSSLAPSSVVSSSTQKVRTLEAEDLAPVPRQLRVTHDAHCPLDLEAKPLDRSGNATPRIRVALALLIAKRWEASFVERLLTGSSARASREAARYLCGELLLARGAYDDVAGGAALSPAQRKTALHWLASLLQADIGAAEPTHVFARGRHVAITIASAASFLLDREALAIAFASTPPASVHDEELALDDPYRALRAHAEATMGSAGAILEEGATLAIPAKERRLPAAQIEAVWEA